MSTDHEASRIAQLEAELDRQRRRADEQEALHRIAVIALAADDMPTFYRGIHEILRGLLYAENLYIALWDDQRRLINWPYYVDSVDLERPEPRLWEPMGTGTARGVTAHVLRTGRPQHLPAAAMRELIESGEIEDVGADAVDWLGVPLVTDGHTVGVLAVQSYVEGITYDDDDERTLAFVAEHIAGALERTRAAAELRQRNAELAIVNEIGQALAQQLDFASVIEAVGDRIVSALDAHGLSIAMRDPATDAYTFMYWIHQGTRRRDMEGVPIDDEISRHIVATGGAVRVGSAEQAAAIGLPFKVGGTQSYLGVPIPAGDQMIGVLALGTHEQNAYGEAEERLLVTLAANMGIALESARLFTELRDRTTELQQRNAELAIVNEVGAALAKNLDFAAILEAVGDRVAVALGVPGLSIAMRDPETDAITFLYWIDEGVRRRDMEGTALDDEVSRHIVSTGTPVRLGSADEAAARGMPFKVGGTQSYLGVPIPVGDRTIGVMALGTQERDAYGDDEERLLLTLATNMGVAIENARLFTELTAALEAKGEAESRYRRLVEEMPLTLYLDRPDEKAASIYVNPTIEAMFGYPPERWYDEDFFAGILHPDDRERVLADHVEAFARGDERWSWEFRVLAADGRTVWVHDEAVVVKDDAGTPQYVQGFMMDVTEQKLANAEIRRQTEYLEALVEVSPVAIAVMDRDEIVTGWNPAAERLFGWTADEAIGRRIDELVLDDEHRDEGRHTTQEARERGRAHRIGQRRRRDGRMVDVEVVLVPLTIDAEHVGYYAIYHDITELVAARHAAEAANEAKSAFLAAMSHEIRTPMNAIIGMSGLLVDTELDTEQRDYAETIRSSGDALLTIINDILDFSKIEAGRVVLEEEPFALHRVVEGALDVLAPAAARKGVELVSAATGTDLPPLIGDQGRLRQILLNLLSNAVKFTDAGEVVLGTEGRRLDDGRWEVGIEVRDTGIGIPADRLGQLFRSFSQLDASISRRYGGTGLGLAISRRLAELMDGSLMATSSGVPGEGSTFRLTIRVAEAAEDRVPDHAVGTPFRLDGRSALVVDDSDTNRRILATQLDRWGMTSRDTAHPREALDWVRAGERFDVALLDVQMPEMEGAELADAIRDVLGSGAPPVILLSSVGAPRPADATIAATLTKPIKPSALHDALATVLIGSSIDEAATSAPVRVPTSATNGSLRVLLVEDNIVNRKLALKLLEREGLAADVATNGLEAIAAVEQAAYDVVLMDVQMPELDGLEATRRIRAGTPAGGQPRIVAMTANAMAGDREACLAAGMDDYLAKPIRPDELAVALDRVKEDGHG
ncbi:MAG TPA: response regulator [Candidatus Angelobacter sp.]|nr:response regulator [Candidatus Angelobacter sp.]